MKKRISIMAGLLAMALVGSAQAATMFAVQNSGGVDQATITDTGDLNANNANFTGKFAGGLVNAPKGPGNVALSGPLGVFHVATVGSTASNAAFLAQQVTTGAGTYPAAVGPNFSFYRINQNTNDSSYVLPLVDNTLGNFIFGTVNTTVDPNLGAGRKNSASFAVKAESAWSATGTAIDVTPTYFVWSSTPNGGVLTERMRLSSGGNLGIGTTGTPTSKLQVVGLQVSDAGPPVGLTSGAFYRTSAGVVMVVP